MNGTQIAGNVAFDDIIRSELEPAESLDCVVKGFAHPDEVVSDLRLTHTEKRETLAFWASDVHAVPGAPALRQLDGGAVVHIDDVLQALSSLNEGADEAPQLSRSPASFGIRLPQLRTHSGAVMRQSWSDDDDDDPPPCPVVSAGPLSGPLFGGEAAEPVLPVAA
jgi:hypothetical protein